MSGTAGLPARPAPGVPEGWTRIKDIPEPKSSPVTRRSARSLYRPGLAPGAEAPACDHGEMVRRAGWSAKSSRYYAGWFCPAKPGACKPIWADADQIISNALDVWRFGHAGAPKTAKPEPDVTGPAEDDAPPW